MRKYADLSPCGAYRYLLGRSWGTRPPVVFVGLNPSIADASIDDPTLRRCVGFAQAWSLDGMELVNLFAYRATKPPDMFCAVDPVGPETDRYIRDAFDRAARIVVCWGSAGKNKRERGIVAARVREVVLLAGDRPVYAIKTTASGQPRHPLYLKSDLVPSEWRGGES